MGDNGILNIMSAGASRAAEGFLGVASVVFLVAYAMPIIRPDLASNVIQACEIAQWAVWALFGIDLIWRFARAGQRASFLLRNWVDVAVFAVPILRPLRLLRAVSMASLVTRRLSAGAALRTSVAIRATATGLLIWFIAALAITDAERGGPGNIQSFVDGLWWALTTITTVGYGDAFPVTVGGRVIAGVLMLTGIGLLSVATGTIASWFVERLSESEGAVANDVRQLQILRDEVGHLRAMLEDQSKG